MPVRMHTCVHAYTHTLLNPLTNVLPDGGCYIQVLHVGEGGAVVQPQHRVLSEGDPHPIPHHYHPPHFSSLSGVNGKRGLRERQKGGVLYVDTFQSRYN